MPPIRKVVLFVPIGHALDVQTENDLIEAKKLKGDVIASSIKGDINLRSIHGRVQAKSVHGRIAVVLATGVTDRPQDVTTETGDIELHIGEDADMEVHIATSGEISTDFSLEIEHRRFEEPGKHAHAVIGEGGPGLTLTSKRGRVRLLRLLRELSRD